MSIIHRSLTTIASLLAVGLPCAGSAQSAPEYKIVKSVALGGPDKWDYVVFDAGSGRVFVAHGDEVTVVDGTSGTIAGHVRGLPGITHGIALVKDSNRGYTDESETGKAASFNLKTLAVENHIQAQQDADAVTFDPVSHHVFVINGDTGTITVIDPKADAAIARITVGGKLEYAVPGENGQIFVNGADKRELVRIDGASNTIKARWPLPDCESPHGLAIDPATHRLFVSCLNQILKVVDSASGQVVATVPIGRGSDAVVFDPTRKLVFSSNGKDGTISVIEERDASTFIALNSIKTMVSGRTMGINQATGRLYVAAEETAADAVADKRTGRVPTIPGSLQLLFLDPQS